jgi:hypothetical protein
MERTYTISRVSDDIPCLTIKGKWLRKLGFELGNKIKLIEYGDCFILMKIPDEVSQRKKQEMRLEELKKEVQKLELELQIS